MVRSLWVLNGNQLLGSNLRIMASDSYLSLLILIFYYCSTKSPATSVGIESVYGLEFQVQFPAGQEIFLFSTASRSALQERPISYAMGAKGFYPGDKAARA
jgi:hypothetical protein